MATSNYWDKRAIKRLTDAEKHSEKYINRVKRVYNQAYKDIDRELASIYRNYSKETGLDTQKLKELLTRSETKKTWEQMKRQGLDKYIKDNYKSRISRLEQLQAQIYAKAKMIYPKEELQNTLCYKGVINQSYYKTMYDTQMGTGYAFNFATIDNNMIDALLSDPWSGANYSQRIWGNTDILANSLSEILGGAMLSGQSMERTAKQIRDRFNVSKYYAERLIRTETNHFNNEVDAMAYEEMGLDKYVFVATLDSRTSEICQLMDNKVFKFSEREAGVNYPPLHPNCRSKTRAYLGAEEEKNLQRRARNPVTGKSEVIDNISYKDWIKQYQNNNNVVKNVKQPVKTNNKTTKTVKTTLSIKDNINDKIDSKLHSTTIDRLTELNKKYPSMDKFFKEKGTTISNELLGFSTNAQVKYDYDIKNVDFSLNNFRYKDYNELITKTGESIKSNWYMPCDKKYYDVYTITHEYGHAIECKLINDYNLSHAEELAKLTEKVEKYKTGNYDVKYAISQTQNITRKYTNKITNDIAQDILKIAHDIDPNFVLSDYISKYGKTNNYEFFAECFANANCGKPNVLGKAMEQYLKERGV